MDAVISSGQLELPIREDRPPKVRQRIAKLWSSWREFRALEKDHGDLMPISVVAGLLDVSGPRVYELIEAGRLDSFLFHTHRYVSIDSIDRFLKTEVKTGRPRKKLSTTDLVGVGLQGAIDMEKQFR